MNQNEGNQNLDEIRRQNAEERYKADTDKRKRSFIIKGLIELPDDTSPDLRQSEDTAAALDIVRYLGVGDPIEAKRTRNGRIGQRNLMVTLPSVEARDKILHRKHFLFAIDGVCSLILEPAHVYPPDHYIQPANAPPPIYYQTNGSNNQSSSQNDNYVNPPDHYQTSNNHNASQNNNYVYPPDY